MRSVAIIGAGASGLTSAVAAKKEGMEPVVFEKSHRIGGVWSPDNAELSNRGAAWPGMRVNVSRHTGTFSNFNWPDATADFPATQDVYEYLHRYAEHFELFPHIRFDCKMIEVKPKAGKWLVKWEEKEGIIKDAIFDAVIIATSKFINPYIPAFSGLDKIMHKMLHSSQYRTPETFRNKKVLVVGGSLSGTSIAEELASTTAVTHLLRKARWVIKRYRSSDPKHDGPFLPRDLFKTVASMQMEQSKAEQYQSMLQHCSEQNECPEWYMDAYSPAGFVIAEHYFDAVRAKKLTPIKGNIASFSEEKVILEDGRSIDFDFVIFCTGYTRDLSYLPESLRLNSPLYEDTFPTDAEQIAFIGMYPGARGAVFPIVEMQARFACSILSNRLSLPSSAKMKEEIKNTPENRDEIQFLTSLATKLGVLPDINAYHIGFRHVLFKGAFTPARFRLTGFDRNTELASKTINETEKFRRQLLSSKDRIPTLASLCFLKLAESAKKKTETPLPISLKCNF